MATIKEVAERARVSVATVSRVVNHSGYVSTDLRERVEEAMHTLQYKPSALARSLRRQETHTIGVLVPSLNQPFFGTLIFAMEKTLFAGDYRTLICSSEEDPLKEAAYVDILLRQRVDGVVLVPTGHSTEGVTHLLQAQVPVVLIDRDFPNLAISRVLSDNYGGAYAGMEHLLTLGHRRIALIGGPAYSRVTKARTDGAEQAMRDYGAPHDPSLLMIGTLPEFELGYQAALSLMKRSDPPTAIFALTDVVAVGVLHAAAQLNLNLPDDLSVMGFDDIPLAAYVIPALTTVAQPIYGMGQTAVEILMRRLHNQYQPHETIQLDTHLVVRNSTAPPKNKP
ncbi:MAG: substrate-binding domain-containing protein [Chloroflexi bacterium]|nr:substrate-binding domain-containing protein [Chloroflexota bacterium]